jgi:integrase
MTHRKAVVTVYVRHMGKCAHDGKPFFRGCDCIKWLRYSGSICLCPKGHKGKQHRINAETRSWGLAEEKAQELQKQLDSGDTTPLTPATPEAKQSTIREQVESFVRSKESQNITKPTIRKLRYQLGLFEKFLADRLKFFPNDIAPTDATDFRASWKRWGDLTRIKAQQNLRGFIRFCCKGNRNDILDRLDVIKQTREGKDRRKPKPLTEAELKTLLAQVPITFKKEAHKIPLMAAFIKGAVSTGLACVDMIHLERKALEHAEKGILTIERRKTLQKATPRLDPALRKELLGVTNGNPRYVFWNGASLPHSASGLWQTDLRRLFDEAGLWIKGNLSHRFRDTAVDFWLGEGASLTEIAAMLGDTVAIVEKHYADLASSRMENRLAKVRARSWS